jgi:hypothetical protein
MSFPIKVENKFEMARRDIHVRRKVWEEILEEHTVNYPVNGEVKMVDISLGEMDGEEDYLEISVDNRRADLGPCKIDLGSNVPFTFIPAGIGSIEVTPPANGETVTSLRIPSGQPAWKLEVRGPSVIPREEGGITNVTVGDGDPGGGG